MYHIVERVLSSREHNPHLSEGSFERETRSPHSAICGQQVAKCFLVYTRSPSEIFEVVWCNLDKRRTFSNMDMIDWSVETVCIK